MKKQLQIFQALYHCNKDGMIVGLSAYIVASDFNKALDKFNSIADEHYDLESLSRIQNTDVYVTT